MCDKCNCGQAHGHPHKQLISDIHSTLENELENAGGYVPDNFATEECRRELAAKPDDARRMVALADALAYQMRYNEAVELYKQAAEIHSENYEIRRKLAARYLSILRVDMAEKEFLWCDARTDDRLDTLYRLALCAYYRADYARCAEILDSCYPYCTGRDEMLIAVIYWDILCAVKIKTDIKTALRHYRGDINCGHHVGYMQAARLFSRDDLEAGNATDGHGELAVSIYTYGLYHYYLYKGAPEKAQMVFDALLNMKTYFSSFAYLGAYTDKLRRDKAEKLSDYLRSNKFALAFSGGTDSAYLLYAAKRAAADFKAYYVRSAFQPEFEYADAQKIIAQTGADMKTITVDILSDTTVAANPSDRCYYCKKRIFGEVIAKASADGYNLIADGTNASDDLAERAGAKALAEYKVVSPLREAKLTKNEIRQLSREAGLFTADKPSYSCLATRVACNEAITQEVLQKIERAESYLFGLGYVDFRVRYKDNCVSLEINRRQTDKVTAEFNTIKQELSKTFNNVTLKREWRL